MNLTEILTAQGLTEDQAKAVIEDMAKNKIYIAEEEGLDEKYKKASELIDQLKKGGANDSDTQKKITGYENDIAKLKSENEQLRIDGEIRAALTAEKATDIDYLMFKIREKGEVGRGDDGKVKGLSEMVTSIKTQCPNQFETDKGNKGRKIEEVVLPKGGSNEGVTKADLLKMPYNERLKVFNEDPEGFKEIMSK